MVGLVVIWLAGAPPLPSLPAAPVPRPRAAVTAPAPPGPSAVVASKSGQGSLPLDLRTNRRGAPPVAEQAARHVRSRTERHPDYPERNGGTPLSAELASWRRRYPGYTPVEFTSPVVLARPDWADPPDVKSVARPFRSYTGEVTFDGSGRPQNPMGRTGIAGRGLLGKWGANFAADPIIVRWNAKARRYEMLAIQRKDTGQWAIPGGMVDEGEGITSTLARELKEETGIDLRMDDAKILYRGYADDPRNTDHAWMETTVALKVLAPEVAARMKPRAADDARATRWIPLDEAKIAGLYGNHAEFARLAMTELGAPPAR